MFTIQMMNSFDSAYHQTWASDEWMKFRATINPMNDKRLAQMQLLRFNVTRTLSAYDEESRELYWKWLDIKDYREAEIWADYYENLYRDLWVDEVAYIRGTLIPKEMARVTDKVLTAGMATEMLTRKKESNYENDRDSITDSDWNRGMLRHDIYGLLAPMITPMAQRFMQSFLEPGSVELKSYIPLPSDSFMYREWRRYQGVFQTNLHISHELLGLDFMGARLKGNELKGISAKMHTLLTNRQIPLPNHATFLAWYSMCGHMFRQISPPTAYQLRKMCGFEPRYVLSYMLPMMPRTKEHVNSGAVRTDDSGADQSLTIRSAGHRRNDFGSIEYGQWSMRTVLIGDEMTHVIADQNLNTTGFTGMSITRQHLGMLPLLDHMPASHGALAASPMLGFVVTPIFDPLLATPTPMRFTWGWDYPVDLPFRSLSKFANLHMRFDEDKVGESASEDWKKAFEYCAIHYATGNASRYNQDVMSAILPLQLDPLRMEVRNKFDIGDLADGV